MKHDLKNLGLIVKYCEYVESDMIRFGDDIEDLMGDSSYQRSTAKSIELIGETVKRLSDELTSRFPAVEWHEICRMRDFMAHQYEGVDLDFQWTTMTEDLPILKRYCLRIMETLEAETSNE